MSHQQSLRAQQTQGGKTRLVPARVPIDMPSKQRGYRASEVVAALGLEGTLRYDRLSAFERVIVKINTAHAVPRTGETGGRGWRTYGLTDIARLVALIDLCGGTDAFARTGSPRLQGLHAVQAAAVALRGPHWGYDDPLLQVPLVRVGRTVLAYTDGQLMEPATGQLVANFSQAPKQGNIMATVRGSNPALADNLSACMSRSGEATSRDSAR